jgi:hypothetical protein
MERQNMTNHQKTIINILEAKRDWLSIKQLSELSGIPENNLRNVMRQKSLIYLERCIFDTKLPTSARYVKVFRAPRNTRSSDDALALAKEHTGIFGQLFWANDKQVEATE